MSLNSYFIDVKTNNKVTKKIFRFEFILCKLCTREEHHRKEGVKIKIAFSGPVRGEKCAAL